MRFPHVADGIFDGGDFGRIGPAEVDGNREPLAFDLDARIGREGPAEDRLGGVEIRQKRWRVGMVPDMAVGVGEVETVAAGIADLGQRDALPDIGQVAAADHGDRATSAEMPDGLAHGLGERGVFGPLRNRAQRPVVVEKHGDALSRRQCGRPRDQPEGRGKRRQSAALPPIARARPNSAGCGCRMSQVGIDAT